MAKLVDALALGASGRKSMEVRVLFPAPMKIIKISKSAGQRIDKFLSEKYREIPRRFFQSGIKDGKFLVNDKEVMPSYKLKEDDQISFEKKYILTYIRSYIRVSKIKPNPKIEFKVVSEHKDFVIIEKPAGLSVHPEYSAGTKHASFGQNSGRTCPAPTLVNGLLAKYPQIKDVGDDPIRPGIVHRLDKDTSGLMIVALNQKTFEFFKDQFKKRKVEKKYVAVVWDSFSLPLNKGEIQRGWQTIQTPIGKSKSDLTKQSTSKYSTKLINPKKAITHYRIIKKLQIPLSDKVGALPLLKGESDVVTLVEVKIDTGRKHQIRVHMHSIGHPVVGDKKYQTKLVREKNKKFARHLLHAYKLKFIYSDGEEYKFESKLPKDFIRL